jgi:STE24 endopeptidase
MIFAFLWLADLLAGQWAVRCGFEGLEDIAAMPILALSGVAMGAAIAPFLNIALRHFERQADRYAIDATGKPESFMSAMRRLASFNMADPSPNPLVEFFFHSHPSIERRIAFCGRMMGGEPSQEPPAE